MAHKVSDRILYGAVGIMEIVDIREEAIGDEPKKYYVLREVNASADAQTYVPADNEQLVSLMHPLLSKKEIQALFDAEDGFPEIEWDENNRQRSESYKAIMESGDRRKMISMIKSIEKMGEERARIGKKNYISDDTAMRRAKKLLQSEISIVMEISAEEAEKYVNFGVLA